MSCVPRRPKPFESLSAARHRIVRPIPAQPDQEEAVGTPRAGMKPVATRFASRRNQSTTRSRASASAGYVFQAGAGEACRAGTTIDPPFPHRPPTRSLQAALTQVAGEGREHPAVLEEGHALVSLHRYGRLKFVRPDRVFLPHGMSRTHGMFRRAVVRQHDPSAGSKILIAPKRR